MPTTTTTDPIEATAKAIDSLLVSIDAAPTQWAVIACKAAIRRLGRQIGETAGPETMRAVLDQAVGQEPDQDKRRAVILDAWDGLAGWHLGAGASA